MHATNITANELYLYLHLKIIKGDVTEGEAELSTV